MAATISIKWELICCVHVATMSFSFATVLCLIFILTHNVVATPLQRFSAANSRVTCGGVRRVVAGYPVTCIAELRTSTKLSWGTEHDACQLFFSFCAANDASGRSSNMLRNATNLGGGKYRITFFPTVAGWTTLAASVAGTTITVTPNTILVNPATINAYRSTSICRQTLGITKCNIKHRDAFGNVVSSCSEYSSKRTLKVAAKCSVLSDSAPDLS